MSAPATEVEYVAWGAAWDIQESTAPEVMLSGPAGTGKSRAILEKLNYCCETFPGIRVLMVRKTRRSLTESGMVTLEKKVLLPSQRVMWHNSSQQYRYPNGSIIAVGGMDKPGKVMSSEWDIIYVQEATELDEEDWEACSTRLRNGRMPYQQLIGDCNPAWPTHWLRLRMDTGRCVEIVSRHEDNPALYTHADAPGEATDGTWTAEGIRYLSVLDALSGVRYARLRLGHWVAAEGMVYQDTWNRKANLVPRFPIPRDWPRYLSVDFGYTNPFVAQWWALDPDGRAYRYREMYRSQRIVEDHAREIVRLSRWGDANGEPLPRAIICDHDAEDRATLERHLIITLPNGGKHQLYTVPADKAVTAGIQNVQARLRPAGDGQPRLFLLADALNERDPLLVESKRPTCTEEEIEGYVWSDKREEEPVKEDDHGMDALRYFVRHLDGRDTEVGYIPSIWQ